MQHLYTRPTHARMAHTCCLAVQHPTRSTRHSSPCKLKPKRGVQVLEAQLLPASFVPRTVIAVVIALLSAFSKALSPIAWSKPECAAQAAAARGARPPGMHAVTCLHACCAARGARPPGMHAVACLHSCCGLPAWILCTRAHQPNHLACSMAKQHARCSKFPVQLSYLLHSLHILHLNDLLYSLTIF